VVERIRREPKAFAVGLLVLVTAAWGSTFVVVKEAVSHVPVASFLAFRFLLASAVLVVLRPRALLRLTRREWTEGALLGLALAAGYLLQTEGLRSTPPAVSGFITGLQVVLTPVFTWLLLRNRVRPLTWGAVVLATVGLGLMSLHGAAVSSGELLTLAGAACFALQIVGLGRWSSGGAVYGVATVQLLPVGLVSLAAALPRGVVVPRGTGEWSAVLVTALAATAFAFVVQTWAQSLISPTRAAVVFTMEPFFAAVVAVAAGEHLGWPLLAGGVLVVAAMLLVDARAEPGVASG
jgi:drug/metabolite transporter (DMT)-like permease